MAKQTVLLVDADVKSARVLEVSLRKAGYSVTLVKSATEAVDAIEIATPDLVLSDTRLAPPSTSSAGSSAPFGSPALTDGYQLCRRLKDDPVWCSIPFIFLTSSSSIEDKIRGLELGVEDYLTKPIYIKEILTRIQLVLAKKQREGMEGRTSRASFSGLLSEMGLVDLLSTIDLGRKSGVLDIGAPGGKGTICFRDGAVVDARVGRYTGALAVYRMLVWNDGQFEIRFGPQQAQDVIRMSTQGLLMEGMRRLDEWQRLQEQLPPLDAVYDVDTRELAARLGEIPDEVNQILRAFNGERTLLEVVDESNFDDLAALATLSKLYFEGLIFQRPAQSGTGADHGDEPVTDVVPGSDEHDQAKVPGADGRTDDAVLAASAGRSVLPPASDVRVSEVDLTPPRVPGMASATPQMVPAPPQNSAAESEPDSQTRNHSIDTASASRNGAANFEERDVAKHRGKRKRAKRQMTEENALRVGGATGAAAQAAAEAEDDAEDEAVESAATSVPPASTASAPAASTPPAAATAGVAAAAAPASAPAASASPASGAEARPEQRERTESNNVIQFPKSVAVMPAVSSAALDRTTTEDENRPTVPSAPPPSHDSVEPGAEARDTKSTPPPVVESKPAAATPPETAAREAAASDDNKKQQPAVEARTSERPASKPSEKPAAKPSESPAEKSSDKAGKDAKGADKVGKDAKADAPAARDRKDSTGARDRKDSTGLRDRKISFSTELTDEAKAFFSDKSYEAAYKPHHDTFEDLKPEETPDTHKNRRAMMAASALVAMCLVVVGGLALYNKIYGVTPPTLPATPATLTPTPGSNGPAVSENNNEANNNGAGETPAANTAANTPPAAGNPEGPAAAGAATEPGANPAGATPPAAGTEPAAANTAANGATPPAANAGTEPAAAGTAPAAAGTTAPATAGATAPAAGTAPAPAAAGTTAATAPAAPGTAAPAAASGPAELLQAAQRARSRPYAQAAAAFQAYIDAGGNDAGAIANFAFLLANRGDLRHAGEWAQRASTMDANNQLAWYVLGVSLLEGPNRNPAAARDALRRCSALPGRYAAECRGAM